MVMLELAETTLTGAGCNKVTNTITAHYSVVHPVIASARIYFEGNAPLPPNYSIAIAPEVMKRLATLRHSSNHNPSALCIRGIAWIPEFQFRFPS